MLALPLLLRVFLLCLQKLSVADFGDDAPHGAHDRAQRVRGRSGVGPAESVRCG